MANTAVGRIRGWMERFERVLVFPLARACFFVVAIVAVLAFAGGGVAVVVGLLRLPIPKPEEPPAAPLQDAVTLARVDQRIADDERQKREAAAARAFPVGSDRASARPSLGTSTEPEDEVDEVEGEDDQLIAQLRALLPDPPHPWENVYEKVCANPTGYGCLSWSQRLKQEGVWVKLRSVVRLRYRRAEDQQEAISALRLLNEVLSQAPVERRADLIVPTIRLWREQQANHQARLLAREQEIASARADYEGKIRAQREAKSIQRRYGLYGLGAGLGLLVCVSLFLAFFALERHTRLMQAVLEAMERAAAPRGKVAAGDTTDMETTVRA